LLALEIIITMFAVGLILGFVGAGGSGFIISVLTALFGFSIHTALGTALAAMVFSTMSATVSHYRENNIAMRTGMVVGGFGALGAYICSNSSNFIPPHELKWMTGGMLILAALVLWLRMFIVDRKQPSGHSELTAAASGKRFWISSGLIGLITGALSGLFRHRFRPVHPDRVNDNPWYVRQAIRRNDHAHHHPDRISRRSRLLPAGLPRCASAAAGRCRHDGRNLYRC
jgi:uncharacterized membrane protein YfcA